MKFADLHLHTVFSDGTYTPEELINCVSNLDIATIAITDHDAVGGITPAIEAAEGKNIEVIPAIELTAQHQGLEVHMLGYFIEYNNKELINKLAILKDNRRERMYKMTDKLREMGIAIEAEEVFKLADKGVVSRLHLARVLIKKGYVNSIYEAFNKYIGEHSPAYICGFRLSAYEAIKLIRDNGGIAVLAHPYSMNRDDLVPLFIEYGMRGLEVYYPEHTKSMVHHYKGLADKYGLLITGGSDCHGNVKSEAHLGSIKLPMELVKKLKQEKAKIK